MSPDEVRKIREKNEQTMGLIQAENEYLVNNGWKWVAPGYWMHPNFSETYWHNKAVAAQKELDVDLWESQVKCVLKSKPYGA